MNVTLSASLGSLTVSDSGSAGPNTLTVISPAAGDTLADNGSAVTSTTYSGSTIHYSGLTAAPTLSTPKALDGFIQSEIASNVTGLVNVGLGELGGFLGIQGLSLNFGSGSVAITATSASFFPGSSRAISVTGVNGGPGITGTFDEGSRTYTLQLAQVALNAPGVMTAQASNVTINYQRAGPSNQTLVTIGSLSIDLPALANTVVPISDLAIREDGFSIANATVTVPTVTWLGALTVTNLGVQFANVNYTTLNDTLAGTITLTAGSVGLFQGQSVFTSTVTGFAGTYTLGTKSLSLAASSVVLSLGGTVGLAANNVSFGLDANAGIFSLTTGPATINIDQVAFLTGSFSLESGERFGASFVGGIPAAAAVSAVTIGGSNVYGFFGTGGPYWQDTAGTVTAAPGANTFGIALGGLNFGLALLTPTDQTNQSNYYALSATADSVTPVFPGSPVTFSANNLALSINASRAPPGVTTRVPAVDFSALPGGRLVVPTGNGGTPVDISFNQGLFQASGNVSLGVAQFFSASGGLTVQDTSSTVKLADGSSVPVNELAIGASNLTAFAGVNGPASNPGALGLSLAGVDFGLAMFTPSSPASGDLRTWTGLEASVDSANFAGVDNLTLGVTTLAVGINGAGGTLGGKPNTTVVDFSANPLTVGDQTLGFAGSAGALTQASGSVTVGAYKFFSATGAFTFQKSTGSVELADGSTVGVNEVLVGTQGASGFLGVGGPAANPGAVGLSLTGVDVGLALLEPTSPASGDLRTWTALKATVVSATIVGLGNSSLTATGLTVAINQAGGTLNGAANGNVVDFSSAPLTIGDQTLNFAGSAGAVVQASGTVSITLFGFFSVSGAFTFQKSTSTVKLTDGSSVPVDVMTIGASGVTAFAGVGGPAANPGAIGLSLTGVNFGLALMRPSTPAAGDLRSWVALDATVGSASFPSIAGLTIGVTSLSVGINQPGGSLGGVANTNVVDFSSAPLTVGPVTLNFPGSAGSFLMATGAVAITVYGFFVVSGTFTFQKSSATVKLADGSSLAVDELAGGAAGVPAFAGINGPATQPGALGLSLTGVDFGLTVLQPTSPAAGDLRSWTALEASVASADFVGVGNLTLGVTTLAVAINQAGGTLNGAANANVVDFSAAPLTVGDQTLSFAGPVVQASGDGDGRRRTASSRPRARSRSRRRRPR